MGKYLKKSDVNINQPNDVSSNLFQNILSGLADDKMPKITNGDAELNELS
jgi:hypothetical protein